MQISGEFEYEECRWDGVANLWEPRDLVLQKTNDDRRDKSEAERIAMSRSANELMWATQLCI